MNQARERLDATADTIDRLRMDVASAQSRANTAERQRTDATYECDVATRRAEKAEAERDLVVSRIGAAIQHIESGGDRERIIDILFPAATEEDR